MKDFSAFKIFDMHTHAYPDNIAEKASLNLSRFYDIPVSCKSTYDDLYEMERSGGSCGFLLFSAATTPDQVVKINNWLSGLMEENACREVKTICFGTIHHKFDDKAGEVERAVKLGLKGFKLHPDIQQIDIDSELLYPFYEAVEGRLPVYLHVGDPRYDYSAPEKLIKIKRRYPALTIIAAHLGGYTKWDKFEQLYSETDVYTDTSSALWAMPPERAREIILAHGADRVLFGTDYPVATIKSELALLDALGLDDDALEKILYGNAARLLGF